jgi:hypothetical protein
MTARDTTRRLPVPRRESRSRACGPLFLETRHSSEPDHDIAATLDAIRILVEREI